MVKKILLSVGFCVVSASVCLGLSNTASATPMCTTQTLAYYEANYEGGCSIGNMVFSNFSDIETNFSKTAVTLDPITNPNDGFKISAAWQVFGNNNTEDTDISFDVAIVGASSIEDAAVAQQSSGAFGNGSVSVTEGGCGPIPCTGETWDVFTFVSGSELNATGDTTFAGTDTIAVTKDIGLSSGSCGDWDECSNAASLSDVEDTFSEITQVPEPASLALLASGLIAFAAAKRRRTRRTAK